MATVHPDRHDAAWRHFTLLDLFLFQAAFGISCSLVFATPVAWQKVPFSLSLASVVGLLLSGPIVLGTQCLLRGRRERLSGGEWLWLSPLMLLAGLAVLSLIEYLVLDVVGLIVGFVSTLASIFSVALAVAWWITSSDRSADELPCYWTDRFGVFVTLYTHLSCWLWVFVEASPGGM